MEQQAGHTHWGNGMNGPHTGPNGAEYHYLPLIASLNYYHHHQYFTSFPSLVCLSGCFTPIVFFGGVVVVWCGGGGGVVVQ